jgi:hypothetical protein
MTSLDFTSPRKAAQPFTPKLTALVESPLFDADFPSAITASAIAQGTLGAVEASQP